MFVNAIGDVIKMYQSLNIIVYSRNGGDNAMDYNYYSRSKTLYIIRWPKNFESFIES